jgi:periplasmic iron binding protein
MKEWVLFGGALALAVGAGPASASEFYIGEPITKNNLQIVPNYLTGIEMSPMPEGAAMEADAIHLEVDVHATKDEVHGFPEDAWIPYLTVTYRIEKVGASFVKSGQLLPMTAADGPHYANNLVLPGPGQYHLAYALEPPSRAGFIRHVDKATGVPDWWQPFTVDWTFTYPSKPKS